MIGVVDCVVDLILMVFQVCHWCFCGVFFRETLLVGECDFVGVGGEVDVYTFVIASSVLFLKIFIVPMLADV